jgi:triphosphoribosyl-dephospho-CoA synthetase
LLLQLSAVIDTEDWALRNVVFGAVLETAPAFAAVARLSKVCHTIAAFAEPATTTAAIEAIIEEVRI